MQALLEEMKQIPEFIDSVDHKEWCYTNDTLETMQVNIGKRCNLACKHCHVEAGPSREELMSRDTMVSCLRVFRENRFQVMDITGGAPEMNPHFGWFVEESRKVAQRVIVRTNLVILELPEYAHLIELYVQKKVELVCSLPCYSSKNTDNQRGQGVFDRSIHMLQKLNALGYGRDSDLALNLVYNPGGAFLPPSQSDLELQYKIKLKTDHDIDFNHLFTITNNPVGRFGQFLVKSGNMIGYMQKLYDSFNASTVENMMCRSQLSVSWNGKLYDCDFNQIIGWTLAEGEHISDWEGIPLARRKIKLGKHCYACTAGTGSSCGGTTA